MSTSKFTFTPTDVVLLLNRLALGLVFLLAGISKISGGVAKFVEESFRGLAPAWLPDWFATPYGYTIPFAETLFGGLLILGLMGRLTAGILTLMLVSFTIALFMAGQATKAGPIHPNIVYIALALLLATIGPGKLSVDGLCRNCCGGKSAA
ncbi:MAG: DoxX family membrane protein [Phycisphaeraceae bacterium]|nr:DoxX family membrane protein [Phycisphaeraceae bacterium]